MTLLSTFGSYQKNHIKILTYNIKSKDVKNVKNVIKVFR